ncbi:hypothetical protein Hanom_Chr13g01240221 [Helianthus anomalus]
MLKPQLNQSHSLLNVLPIQKPFIHSDSANHSSSYAYAPTILRQHTSFAKKSNATGARSTSIAGNIKAISIPFLTNETTVKCVITILPTIGSTIDGISNAGVSLGGVTDLVSDLLGRSFLLELVSNDLDCTCIPFLCFNIDIHIIFLFNGRPLYARGQKKNTTSKK